MASILAASNTGIGGLIQTADSSGDLQLTSSGVATVTLTGANIAFVGNLTLSNTSTIQLSGDPGVAGAVLTSQGPNTTPTWAYSIGSTLMLWSQLS